MTETRKSPPLALSVSFNYGRTSIPTGLSRLYVEMFASTVLTRLGVEKFASTG